MLKSKPAVLALLSALMLASSGQASEPEQTLRIGVVAAAPYAAKNAKGEWEGISVDLWQAVASMLDIKYQYQECDYSGFVDDIEEGRLDAAIGRLSALDLHDPDIDFTHSYFFSGLAIAIPKLTERQHWMEVLRMLRESDFTLLAILILITLAISAVTIWLLERRRNPGHFPDDTVKGIWSGIWWSASTITTIGYGDKVPVTFWGRLLALIWMVIGILLVAVFTATITSLCTVSHLNMPNGRLQDLYNKRVGIASDSQTETFLQKLGIEYEKAATTPEALGLLENGKVDMVIDDQATLKYYCQKQKLSMVRIMPTLLTMKGYSFALKKDHKFRDSLNQAIRDYTSRPEWHNIFLKYLGN